MRPTIGLLAVIALSWASAGIAFAQATQPADARMDKLEQRLNDMEQRYQAEIKKRDDEIARLKGLLERPPATAPTTRPAPAADEIERTKQDVLRDLDSRSSPPPTSRNPVSFNPDLAVISDFAYSWSQRRDNDAFNRFDVREVELDLRAAVDPRADGVAILALARDANPSLFPGEELEGPDTSVEVEEAYLFLHDFGVPNLTAKLGRYHVRFGRQNVLHLHDLPTSDAPFVNQSFLAPEALVDSGLSLSYVIPNPWNQYFEAILEINSGEGGSNSESPTLHGDVSVDSPSIVAHFLWNHDLGKDWNLELGASWLTGHADKDNSLNVNLFGGDFTLLHTDPKGRFNNQVFQAEVMHGIVDQPDDSTSRAWGAYVLAQQQLNKDWYVGLRLDWTQDANDDNKEIWGASPYVSWYWSEFLRFRAEYQHRGGDVPDTDIVYLQATWIFGAHPPHPYWAMR